MTALATTVCRWDGCRRRSSRGGTELCWPHEKQTRVADDPSRQCARSSCTKPIKARGLCESHYYGHEPHGSPVERFWAKVDLRGPVPAYRRDLGPCWVWTAATGTGGYGQFWLEGAFTGAHRYAYELLVGPIAEGLEMDHLCFVPACVNPTHLEAVTSAENTRRAYEHQRWLKGQVAA